MCPCQPNPAVTLLVNQRRRWHTVDCSTSPTVAYSRDIMLHYACHIPHFTNAVVVVMATESYCSSNNDRDVIEVLFCLDILDCSCQLSWS